MDLVVQRCVVRGLASPHSILDAVRWEIWTFFELRRYWQFVFHVLVSLEMYMNIGSSGIFCATPGAASAGVDDAGSDSLVVHDSRALAGLPQRHDV